MEAFEQSSYCPVCAHPDVAEHIEVTPVEDRVKGPDRRRSEDLAFLSLIATERRKIDRDRRGIDTRNLIVEHHASRKMLCLKCEHEWSLHASATCS